MRAFKLQSCWIETRIISGDKNLYFIIIHSLGVAKYKNLGLHEITSLVFLFSSVSSRNSRQDQDRIFIINCQDNNKRDCQDYCSCQDY